MKKFETTALSVMLVISLAGCGKNVTGSGSSAIESTETSSIIATEQTQVATNEVDEDVVEDQAEVMGNQDVNAILDQVGENADDFAPLLDYIQKSDGTYECNGYTYKYKLEITGRMNAAATDSTFVYLSNMEEITFDQAMKASGLSSNMADYFDPSEAVLIGWK